MRLYCVQNMHALKQVAQLTLPLLLVYWTSSCTSLKLRPASQAGLTGSRKLLAVETGSALTSKVFGSGSSMTSASTGSNITAEWGPGPSDAVVNSSLYDSSGNRTTNLTKDFEWNQFINPGEEFVHLIVVFRKRKLAERFAPLCGGAQHQQLREAENTSTGDSGLGSRSAQMPASCSLLLGVCRRMFRHAFVGLAGRFSKEQFAALQTCAGHDSISYVERDGQVAKAESGDYTNWWQNKAPRGISLKQLIALQQQQLTDKHPESLSDSVQVQAYDTASVGDSVGQQQQPVNVSVQTAPHPPHDLYNSTTSDPADKDLNSSNAQHNSSDSKEMKQLWSWILAEVGLAAQKQLANGVPQVVAVADKFGVSTGTISVQSAEGSFTTEVQGLQEGGSQVTKNQDPGLPVDAAAIANPEIVAFMPADENATGPSAVPQAQVEQANVNPGVKRQKLVAALWNLDRIDQRKLPLDGTFSYGSPTAAGTGKNVTIYMLDSGIKANHQEFQPWGSKVDSKGRAEAGPDFVDDDTTADDCDGHGTHVSSTAAGRSVGIAREATVVGVRVLDCDGAGSISNVVAALDWVASNAKKPAVASLSLGVPSGQWSRSLEEAVASVVAAGITVVVAAGNSAVDACGVAPANVPEALTVAASNLPTKFSNNKAGDTENLYRWSNTGSCIDVFAPGVDIYGACGGPSRCEVVNDTAYTWASGTSMAAPHVTGMVAVYLETHPYASPAEVHDAIVNSATAGMLNSPLMLEGTPNRLLFSKDWSKAVDEDSSPDVVATEGNP